MTASKTPFSPEERALNLLRLQDDPRGENQLMRNWLGWPDNFLTRIGGFRKAKIFLDQALKNIDTNAKLWTWRAELALLEADLPTAKNALLKAAACRQNYPRLHAVSAALSFKTGDWEEASLQANLLIKARPKAAAGYAISALIAAQRGQKTEALAYFEKALRRKKEGWIYALRGSLRAKWGELSASLKDLGRACQGSPHPWVIIERADGLRKLGLWAKAFEMLRNRHGQIKDSRELLLRVGSMCLDQAQYSHAARCYKDALRLSPEDATLHRELSKVRFMQGLHLKSLLSIEKALELAPQDPDIQERRIQLLILNDRINQARRDWRRVPMRPGSREFLSGYLHARLKNYKKSEEAFRAAEPLLEGRESLIKDKVDLYRLTMKVLASQPPPTAPKQPELVLLGLGMRQPFQVGLETLYWLSGCDTIYNYISDSNVFEFLSLFPAERKSVIYRPGEDPAEVCARLIMSDLKSCRRIGFVTRGNAMIYGKVPKRLVRECQRHNILCRATGSISMLEFLPTLSGNLNGTRLGVQIRSFFSITQGIDCRIPLVVYSPSEKEDPYRIPRTLARHYSPSHPCHLFLGAGGNEISMQTVPIKDLGRILPLIDPGAILFLPPAK